MNKIQAAEQLRMAIQMFCQGLEDDSAIAVATVFPAWEIGKKYAAKEIASYGVNAVGDPQLYRCEQAHTSQADWTPDITTALWTAIGIADDGIPIWSQPAGSHDAYGKGDRVHYPGKTDPIFESLIDNNIWSPDAYPAGWEQKV